LIGSFSAFQTKQGHDLNRPTVYTVLAPMPIFRMPELSSFSSALVADPRPSKQGRKTATS